MKLSPYKILLFLLSIMIIGCQDPKVDPVVTGFLEVEVKGKEDLLPIADVIIKTLPASSTVITDENGYGRIEQLAVNSYSIRAEKSGYNLATEAFNITSNATTQVFLFLEESSDGNIAPTTPTLVAPTNNAINQPLNVDLIWSSSDLNPEDELLYTLSVFSSNAQFPDQSYDLTDTIFTLTNLDYDTRYSWQISVSDGIAAEVFSPIHSFTTLPFPNDHEFWFTRMVNGNRVIYSSDEEGNSIALTDNSYNSWSPQVNIATGKVAFISDRDQEDYLYLMDIDGKNQQRIPLEHPIKSYERWDIDFCWGPVGNQLLYMNYNRLFRVNLESDVLAIEVVELGGGQAFLSCDWSFVSGMQRIAALAATTGNYPELYNSNIYLFDLMGNVLDTLVHDLPGKEGGGRFSPDGLKFLYTSDISGYEAPDGRVIESHILRLDLKTGAIVDLTGTDNASGFLDLDPRYSPEGSSIIYTEKSNSLTATETNIYIMEENGNNRQLLFPKADMPDWQR